MSRIVPHTFPGMEPFRSSVDHRAIVGRTKQLFSKYEEGIHDDSYERDKRCWLADVDLTCLAVWNGTGGRKNAATLISPRHVQTCVHFPLMLNCPIVFVGMDNSICVRTYQAYAPVHGTDIMIGYLNEKVDPWIKPAGILTKVESPEQYLGTPVIYSTKEKAVFTADIVSFDRVFTIRKASPTVSRSKFFRKPVKFDSGNPFLVVRDTEVAVASHTIDGIHGLPYYVVTDRIMDVIEQLGPERPVLW